MENQIDITKCPKNPPVQIYNPDGTLLVETTEEAMFYYVRAEIKEKHLEGYYIMYNGEKIKIDINGDPEHYPSDMMEVITEQLLRLIK